MASVVVVGMEEVRQGFGAFGVAGVRAHVRPFVEQGAIEALHLAVRLRAIGSRPLVGNVVCAERLGEQPGSVAGAVVGEDAFDGDAVGDEEGVRALPEEAVSLRSSVRTSL